MSCANVLSIPMDTAFTLYRTSPSRSPRLLLHPRPCLQSRSAPPSPRLARTRPDTRTEKRVVFADSKGLSLTSVCLISRREERPYIGPRPPPAALLPVALTLGPRLRLGFAQPNLALRQSAPVMLESCCVTARAVRGTVRVRNISYEKAVHVRVTFDSWRSHRDVACAFLRQHEPDVDVFAFDVELPVSGVDARERIEFCVSYLPAGHREALWDNNNGDNYSLYVCD